MIRVLPYLAVLTTLAALPAQSQGAPDVWQGGLIVRTESSALIGDNRTTVLPGLSYRADRFSLGFDGARYTIEAENGQEFQFILSPRFPSFDDEDAAFAGMSRDIGLDFGARYALDRGPFEVSVTALQGLTDEQDGQELDLRFSHRLGRLPLTVYAGAAWQSGELTEYLYGVRPDETAPGRPAYSPGGAITPYIGVSGAVPLGESSAFIGTLEAYQLPDTITDSPIVEDTGAARATLGIVFNF